MPYKKPHIVQDLSEPRPDFRECRPGPRIVSQEHVSNRCTGAQSRESQSRAWCRSLAVGRSAQSRSSGRYRCSCPRYGRGTQWSTALGPHGTAAEFPETAGVRRNQPSDLVIFAQPGRCRSSRCDDGARIAARLDGARTWNSIEDPGVAASTYASIIE
jgi:hypothetical protein